MKNLYFIFLLLISIAAKAQVNLVPNPSFEDYIQCPTTNGQIQLATGWYSPTLGSPDYFNTCSNAPNWSPPQNFFGNQIPHTGEGYVGLGPYYSAMSNWREYIQTELTEDMVNGKIYCIEFYISLAEVSQYGTNNMGIVFSTDSVKDDSISAPTLHIPTSFNDNTIVTDTSNWVKVAGLYQATGGERYMTIGNFYFKEETDTILVNNNNTEISYYYIDDISVIECDTVLPALSLPIPNVFTPNNDAYNDIFEIQFLPPNSQLIIYNRWGSMVYQSNNYQNNWAGDNLSDGVYYYILQLPFGTTKKGTVTILRG